MATVVDKTVTDKTVTAEETPKVMKVKKTPKSEKKADEKVKSYKDAAKEAVKDDDMKSAGSTTTLKSGNSWADEVEAAEAAANVTDTMVALPTMDELAEILVDAKSDTSDNYDVMKTAYDGFIKACKVNVTTENVTEAQKQGRNYITLLTFDPKKRVSTGSDITYLNVFQGTMSQKIHGEGAEYDENSRISDHLKKRWTLAFMNDARFTGIFHKLQDDLGLSEGYEIRVYKTNFTAWTFELLWGDKDSRIAFHQKCAHRFGHAWKINQFFQPHYHQRQYNNYQHQRFHGNRGGFNRGGFVKK